MTGVRKAGLATEATFDTRPYKLHRLDEPPAAQAQCTRDDAILYYTQMQVIRRMESAASNLYKEKVSEVQLVICIKRRCVYKTVSEMN